MINIVSLDDQRVADYRRLADPDSIRDAGLFVAEGRLVVRRLLATPRFHTRSVLVTEAARESLGDVLDAAPAAVDIFLVDQSTMNAIAGFNIHRGCLALAERPAQATLETLPLDRLARVVVMEGVNNPDNVGGIFRSAAAFGVEAVVLGPASGDPLYRKAVRTSMAATLAIPFVDAGPWPDAIHTLRAHGLRVLALTPSADARSIDDVPRDLERVAILVGAEGEGLSAKAMAAADECVTIPMSGLADSLNVTVAASVALFALSRKR